MRVEPAPAGMRLLGWLPEGVSDLDVADAARQAAFVAIARRELGDLMRVEPAPAGMRLLGWLPAGVRDVDVADAARRRGVDVVPLSLFRATPGGEPALMLGYAPFSASQAQQALRVIAQCIRAATITAARNAPGARSLSVAG